MAKLTFIAQDGTSHEVQAKEGVSVMQAAVDNGIEEILAECGGLCSCATCHCYVDENWFEKTGAASGIEKEMLECVLTPETTSRLICQIPVTKALDGAIFHLPEEQ